MLVLALIACATEVLHERHPVPEELVRASVTVDRGAIRWRAGETAPHLDVIRRWTGEPPEVTVTDHGGVLVVDGSCAGTLGACAVDVVLSLPAGVPGDLALGWGDVALTGPHGSLEVDLGAGVVVLDESAGNLSLRAGVAEVRGRRMVGSTLLAEVEDGTFDLAWANGPGNVLARTGHGDVHLVVSRTRYDIRAETDDGDVWITGLDTDPAAARTIDVWTRRGDVVLSPR